MSGNAILMRGIYILGRQSKIYLIHFSRSVCSLVGCSEYIGTHYGNMSVDTYTSDLYWNFASHLCIILSQLHVIWNMLWIRPDFRSIWKLHFGKFNPYTKSNVSRKLTHLLRCKWYCAQNQRNSHRNSYLHQSSSVRCCCH